MFFFSICVIEASHIYAHWKGLLNAEDKQDVAFRMCFWVSVLVLIT